jgi:hypothetical protein
MKQYIPLFEDFKPEEKQENKVGTWIEFSEKIGAGVLAICESTGRLLLGKRSGESSDSDTWGEFGIKFTKEGDEQEENVLYVVEQAFRLQTAYSGKIKLIPSFIYETTGDSYKYYNFIAILPEEFTPTLSGKNKEFKWFTLDELKKMNRKAFHFGLKMMWEKDGDTITKYAK